MSRLMPPPFFVEAQVEFRKARRTLESTKQDLRCFLVTIWWQIATVTSRHNCPEILNVYIHIWLFRWFGWLKENVFVN